MTVRILILLLYLAVMPLKAADLVLCLDLEGMSLRHMSEPCSDTSTPPADENANRSSASSLADIPECCPCVDLPLAGDSHSEHFMPGSKAYKADVSSSLDLPLPETLPAFDLLNDGTCPPSPELNTILLSIRCVVLLS